MAATADVASLQKPLDVSQVQMTPTGSSPESLDMREPLPSSGSQELGPAPKSPVDHDHAVASRAAIRKLEHGHKRGFYAPARKLLEWGAVQYGRHASWSDLFWDLIFVGSAFKVGDYFKSNIQYAHGPVVLMGAGLTIVNTWSHLLQYRCRFEANSVFHKMVDVLEGLLCAAQAHNVVKDPAAFEAYNMYAFVAMVLLCRAVQAFRRLELVLTKPPPAEYGSTRYAALDMLVRTLVEMSLLCVCFAFESVYALMTMLISVWAMQVTLFTAPALLGWYQKKHLVPIHVEYTVHRMGEMVMLMLGEGMLSLVLSETVVDTTEIAECGSKCWVGKLKSGVSFASGYVLLAALMYLYYRCNRFTRHHHAVRRSAARGILWNNLHWPLCLSLIGAGVCLKAIQPYAAKPSVERPYINAFGASTAYSMLTICIQQLLHPGLGTFLAAPQKRAKRVGLFAAKIAISLGPVAMSWFPESTEGWVYLFYTALLGIAAVVLLTLEKSKSIEKGLWFFADHRPAASQRGGTRRDAMYHSRKSMAIRNELARAEAAQGRTSSDSSDVELHTDHAPPADAGAGAGAGVAQPHRRSARTYNSAAARVADAVARATHAAPAGRVGMRRPSDPSHNGALDRRPMRAHDPLEALREDARAEGMGLRRPRHSFDARRAGMAGVRYGFDKPSGGLQPRWPTAAEILAAAEDAPSASDSDSDSDDSVALEVPHNPFAIRESKRSEAEDVNSAVVLTG